jgi:hypothetical protein
MDTVLVENAKKMLDSGVSKEEVISMLVSLGYDEKEVKQVVDGSAPEEPEEESEKKEDLVIEEKAPKIEKPVEKSKEYAEHAELASTMAMTVVDNATKTLDEHKESMNALNENITKTYDKLDSISLDKIDTAHDDIAEIRKSLADLAAKTNVTLDLMKKILENQRELIMKLK